jgi:hypothetical protein
MMREPVHQRRRHVRIAEHAGPLAEAQVDRDHHAGSLVEFGQQVDSSAPREALNGR